MRLGSYYSFANMQCHFNRPWLHIIEVAIMRKLTTASKSVPHGALTYILQK